MYSKTRITTSVVDYNNSQTVSKVSFFMPLASVHLELFLYFKVLQYFTWKYCANIYSKDYYNDYFWGEIDSEYVCENKNEQNPMQKSWKACNMVIYNNFE